MGPGQLREDCMLWLLVHTMTITEVDYQVRAQFVHAVLAGSGSPGTRLLTRRIRMRIHPNVCRDDPNKRRAYMLNAPGLKSIFKRKSVSVKHHVRTMQVGSCSSNKSSPIPCQSVNQSGPIVPVSKQQHQQPIVQVVAPLQQVQTSQEPAKYGMQMTSSCQRVTTTTTNEEVMTWLAQNRFQKFKEDFQNFNGHDLLRLSRNDILQVCGEADGIRFFNILHDKAVTPRSKIYVCKSNTKVFHAVFLTSSTKDDLKHELCSIIGMTPDQVQEVYMEGPNNIHVIVSDSVVYHIKEESAFSISTLKEKDQYVLLLKLIK